MDWLRLALLLLLVDGAWGSLWTAVQTTDWQAALKRWRTWDSPRRKSRGRIKLTEPRLRRVRTWLGQAAAWWREVVWPQDGAEVATAVAALLASAALAVQLGVGPVLASFAALAVLQLGLLRRKGGIDEGAQWPVVPSMLLSLLGAEALFVAALPWAAGQVAYGRLTIASLALGMIFAVAYWAASRESPSLRVAGLGAQLGVAGVLLVLHQPIGAGCVALLLAPQIALLLWLRFDQPVDWYVRHTEPWLAAAMLVAAGSL